MTKRFLLLIFTLFLSHCFLICDSVLGLQSTSASITITIEDSYTNLPVDSVLVRLLQNGSELTSGTTDQNGAVELPFSFTSATEDIRTIPESFRISESYPNPFRAETSVDIEVDEKQEVAAEVFNVIGQKVASLNVLLSPGVYTLRGALGHLAQGMYFIRIRGQEVKTVKMTKIGNRISGSGAVLRIAPSFGSPFLRRAKQSASSAAGQNNDFLITTSKTAYDPEQRNVSIESDTTFNFIMSRNNIVIFRVADESNPSADIERSIQVTKEGFNRELVTPDTLILKSGIYSITGDEGVTDAINTEIEIASEDKTVTLLSRLKSIADNQALFSGEITDSDTNTPIDRGYIYVLDESTTDTLAGPFFANSLGLLSNVVTFEDAQDKQLRLLYRKDGFIDDSESIQISLPDTIDITRALAAAAVPVAQFEISGELRAGEPVQFDASASSGASGEDLTYSWDFGNGKRGFSQTLSHVYSSSGNYDLTLTVTGNFGSSNTATQSINISNSTPAPSTTLITGEITTASLEPLEGVTAQLIGDDIESISGTDGRIVIGNLPSGIPVVMRLTKPGYASQSVRLSPDENVSENFFTAAMIPLEEIIPITSIENGADITGKDGARLSVPVDGLIDSKGELVTGDVDLTITPLNTSSDEIFAFPGGFEGVRPDGEMGNILSYGVADYTFSRDGEPLQVMPGKRAEIEIPVYSSEVSAGEVIPLWTLDEETGLWIEEGTGTIISSAGSPTGLAMRAETGHFSWKNIDVFVGGTGFESLETFTLVPRCRNTETDLFIACTIRGQSLNADGSIAGFAPTVIIPVTGDIELDVPLNKTFDITAFSDSGNLTGIASIPPVANSDEIINITIDLSPRFTSEEISIAYGDFLKGKSSSSEITRYKFEGEQDDFIKIRIREGLGFDGNGDVFLLNSDEEVLEQGNYANNFSRYLFENLPETGTYFIDIAANTDISNYDIELDLFEGAVNREISYGDRIFDFLWPGQTNRYSFEGETEQVVKFLARNVQGEGSLTGRLVLNTTNPLVSDSVDFFGLNVFVTRLEEKNGTYFMDIKGPNDSGFGEYVIDIDTTTFFEPDQHIAYGDSAIGVLSSPDEIQVLTFDGGARDLVRVHIENPYPLEESNRTVPHIRLLDPDGNVLDDASISFGRFERNIGLGYILPSEGKYSLEIEDKGQEFNFSPEGEVYSLLLRKFDNPFTRNLDEAVNGLYRDEFFANELDINRYLFSEESDLFTRLSVDPKDSQRPGGKLLIFDENSQFVASDDFRSSKRSVIDKSLPAGGYTGIVVSNFREDVRQSSNETYNIQMKKAETREFNTKTNELFLPNTLQYFHFMNSEAGREVSVAAVGSFNKTITGFEDPMLNSASIFFANSQSFLPTILENQGDYLLPISSGSFSADFDLTVVDLEPAGSFNLDPDNIITLFGAIRLSGDIDRFDFTPDTDGTITITLKPAAENSIDDTGNLRIQIRNPDTNGLVSASSENSNPEGDELYIWQGNVSGQNDYRIHIWDQEAITSGDFIIEVAFTADP